jgi:hypothetical protein
VTTTALLTPTTGRRVWHLPATGVLIGQGDVVLLRDRQYRFGSGPILLAITNLGDSDRRVDPNAMWVNVDGGQLTVFGTDMRGRVNCRFSSQPYGRGASPLRRQPPTHPVTMEQTMHADDPVPVGATTDEIVLAVEKVTRPNGPDGQYHGSYRPEGVYLRGHRNTFEAWIHEDPAAVYTLTYSSGLETWFVSGWDWTIGAPHGLCVPNGNDATSLMGVDGNEVWLDPDRCYQPRIIGGRLILTEDASAAPGGGVGRNEGASPRGCHN